MTLAHKLASDALANLTFDSEREYFIARASVQAAIAQAWEFAARDVVSFLGKKAGGPAAARIRSFANREAKP